MIIDLTIQIHILGAAAGGGLPQWNCGCENCNLARNGAIPSLTQSSIAVSADGENWSILNASPDIRQQLSDSAALAPRSLRHTPINSVLLTNADLDHIAGLLCLREGQPFSLLATSGVHDILKENPIFSVLREGVVSRKIIDLEQEFELCPGLKAKLFAVPGKVPLFLERGEVNTELLGEQTVGVMLSANGKRAFYIPGCATLPIDLLRRIDGAEALFFDGTLWDDDEMIRAGLGQKTGRRMGHIPISGSEGSLQALAALDIGQRFYIHINNSNPILRPDTPERATVEAAGWTIGIDGMQITV